jgi:hypothetical protein
VAGFHACFSSSKTSSAQVYAKASAKPMARATRAINSQSGSACPGGSSAARASVRFRSELTITPSPSAHSAAGSTTSA